ncbi:MAG: signal peptidase II [Cellulophaga sp.]
MKMTSLLKKTSLIALILVNVGCDQFSKIIVRKHILSHDYIDLFNNNFILTNVENTGAMLGFGKDFAPILKIIFLQVLPVIVLLFILYRILTKKDLNKWLTIAFAFVIGGGISNLIDRIAYGSVTDFFQIKFGVLKTGIFNMADVSVTTGAILIFILSVRHKNLNF